MLLCILHLHNKLLASLILAIHVKNSLAFGIHVAHMFAVQKVHIFHHLLTIKKRVKETYQQVLVRQRAENALKSKVCKKTYITFLSISHNLG